MANAWRVRDTRGSVVSYVVPGPASRPDEPRRLSTADRRPSLDGVTCLSSFWAALCRANEHHQSRLWVGMPNLDSNTDVVVEELANVCTQGGLVSSVVSGPTRTGARSDARPGSTGSQGACASDQCARGLAAPSLAATVLLNRVWAPSGYQHTSVFLSPGRSAAPRVCTTRRCPPIALGLGQALKVGSPPRPVHRIHCALGPARADPGRARRTRSRTDSP